MNIGLGCITQADIRFVGGYSPWFSSLPFLNINSMLNFKHLFLVSVALWSTVGMVRAQEFDPKQSYEIHTQNGLVLDNQESLDLGGKIFISKKEPHKESQVWNLIPCGNGCYSIVSRSLNWESTIAAMGARSVRLSNGTQIKKIPISNGVSRLYPMGIICSPV